jgi:hypothetical protein
MKGIVGFVSELFRRKVVRLLGAYIAILWLLAQGYASFYEAFGLPDWSLRAFLVVGIAMIPLLAFFSWKYDIAPPQLVRDAHDLEAKNPAISWAARRHDNSDAGFILLKWSGDDESTKERRFFRPVSIGRGFGNDIDLTDQRVSRFHAVIWAEEGGWRIRDLDSANGTYINHSRVQDSSILPHSCELRFHAAGPTVSVHIDKPAETLIS